MGHPQAPEMTKMDNSNEGFRFHACIPAYQHPPNLELKMSTAKKKVQKYEERYQKNSQD